MRKVTAITLALFGVLRAASAKETTPPAEPVTLASIQANPLMLLPGMDHSIGRPSVSIVKELPTQVIAEVTNYPNPFDSRKPGLEGQTTIEYWLAQDAKVSLQLYDLLGMRVRGWTFAPTASGARAGVNRILWDGTDESGRKVSKGGYLAEIQVESPQTTATVLRKIGVIH